MKIIHLQYQKTNSQTLTTGGAIFALIGADSSMATNFWNENNNESPVDSFNQLQTVIAKRVTFLFRVSFEQSHLLSSNQGLVNNFWRSGLGRASKSFSHFNNFKRTDELF